MATKSFLFGVYLQCFSRITACLITDMWKSCMASEELLNHCNLTLMDILVKMSMQLHMIRDLWHTRSTDPCLFHFLKSDAENV
uniref:Secreted protein n=1 Tax=Steinernema glaseri TaxID=37863 RepID=A0A1I7Y7M2_9BILA